MMKLPRTQSGMSLVELMIAITLSLILSLGIIQIFSSSKQTSRVQNELARLQENARFALDLLSSDIRMAGQLGCNSNVHVNDSSNGSLGPFSHGIRGYDYAATDDIKLTANGSLNNVVDGTDVIMVIAAGANAVSATSTTAAVTAGSIAPIADIDEGDPAIVSDCETADLFIAGAREPNSNILPVKGATLSKTYSDNAEIAKLDYTAYYLRADADGVRNLYRSYVNNLNNNPGIRTEALLAGVEDFQILYGQDINGDGSNIRYVDADNVDPTNPVADMSDIISVRIHLLLATTEDNLAPQQPQPQQYWFMDDLQTAAAGDRRLFRSFTTTIQLRNQGIGT